MLDFVFRALNKFGIFHSKYYNKASIALITSKELIPIAMEKLTSSDIYKNYFISYILILDGKDTDGLEDYKIPVCPLSDESLKEICHIRTDEVFIIQPDDMAVSRKLGKYKVLSTGINFATAGQRTK